MHVDAIRWRTVDKKCRNEPPKHPENGPSRERHDKDVERVRAHEEDGKQRELSLDLGTVPKEPRPRDQKVVGVGRSRVLAKARRVLSQRILTWESVPLGRREAHRSALPGRSCCELFEHFQCEGGGRGGLFSCTCVCPSVRLSVRLPVSLVFCSTHASPPLSPNPSVKFPPSITATFALASPKTHVAAAVPAIKRLVRVQPVSVQPIPFPGNAEGKRCSRPVRALAMDNAAARNRNDFG